MDEEELQRVYQWIDEIPLSRPKRNIARDFADGVLIAEVVAHYYPRMVELHNYPSANSFAQKLYNWQTLNKKVFKKLALQLTKVELEALCNAEQGGVEQLLKKLQVHLAKYNLRKKQQAGASEGADDSPGGGEYADEPFSPTEAGREQAAQQQQQQLSQGAAHLQYMPPAAQQQPQPVPQQGGYQGQMAGDSFSMRAPGAPPTQQATAAALAAGAEPRLLLQERDQTVDELSETVEILEIKVKKLEQLVRIKDAKIQTLGQRLQQYEIGAAQQQMPQGGMLQQQQQQRPSY